MADEDFIELEHGRIWYRQSGGGNAMPVLLLHGGCPHGDRTSREAHQWMMHTGSLY